jgi:hypothetical protein
MLVPEVGFIAPIALPFESPPRVAKLQQTDSSLDRELW